MTVQATGPYVVTVKRERGGAVRFGSLGEPEVVYREAFAMLEEAQARLARRVGGAVDRGLGISQAHDAIDNLPGSGGTLTLPKGDVIEVERVGMLARSQFSIGAMLSTRATDEQWCAAWNAEHGIGTRERT